VKKRQFIRQNRDVAFPDLFPVPVKTYETNMAIKDIKAFSDKARAEPELKEKLIACQKVRELLTLARENGFQFIEDEMYPPNEPQFTADQLSERLAKALLRA
jgi:predicted ribosomally synthesized peptide with nif11-like leader